MNDSQTVDHLREWVKSSHDIFTWPTDGCGYAQHIRFVKYRNEFFYGKQKEFNQFVLDYADKMEQGLIP